MNSRGFSFQSRWIQFLKNSLNKEEYAMRWLKLVLIASIAVVGMIGLVACGDDDKPTSSGTMTLTIINELEGYTIFFIYVSPTGMDTWGMDRLGSGNVLSPGEEGTLELSKGTYDIKIVDEDGDTYIKMNLDLKKDYTWRVKLSELTVGKPVAVGPRSKPLTKEEFRAEVSTSKY